MNKVMRMALASILLMGTVSGCGGDEPVPPPAPSPDKPITDIIEEDEIVGEAGSVYYLNFKPEQAPQWEELAEIYTDQTGIDVIVETAASGTYESTLKSAMAKSAPPTMFQVNGPVGLQAWKNYCYDLTGTPIVDEVSTDEVLLMNGDEIAGVGYVVETFGIIYNKDLLEQAGYTEDDITNFETLKTIAEDITARKDELGFSAFTSAGMEGSSDWRFKTHLANVPLYYEYKIDNIGSTEAVKGTYLDNYKNIWDLYINNSTVSPTQLSAKTLEDAIAEFVLGEAVFFQNGTWAYTDIADLGDENLGMIPIYIGVEGEENQGLCTGTENYWCVNKNASQEDIDATIDFMTWVVTDPVAVAAICGTEGALPSGQQGMGFVIPFKSNLPSANPLINIANAYVIEGKIPVSWNFATMPSEQWKNGVGSALVGYAAGTEDWDAVQDAFVDGWVVEYQASNQ